MGVGFTSFGVVVETIQLFFCQGPICNEVITNKSSAGKTERAFSGNTFSRTESVFGSKKKQNALSVSEGVLPGVRLHLSSVAVGARGAVRLMSGARLIHLFLSLLAWLLPRARQRTEERRGWLGRRLAWPALAVSGRGDGAGERGLAHHAHPEGNQAPGRDRTTMPHGTASRGGGNRS